MAVNLNKNKKEIKLIQSKKGKEKEIARVVLFALLFKKENKI